MVTRPRIPRTAWQRVFGLLATAGIGLCVGVPAQAAQQVPNPTKEDLAKDNKLFITLARKALKWDEPTAPSKIVGPLHYVGTAGLASYLFATEEGHILFNTGMPDSGPMIVASIRTLGFDPKEIKILINGHGHSDHAGAFAYFKKLTGAQVAIMEPDVAMIEDGGKSDFQCGHDWQIMGKPSVKVDRVLHDGDTVRLGDVLLIAHHTPGHTRGATTWETTLVDTGRAYRVVWPDGGGFNPGYRIAKEPTSYPGINADYRRSRHLHEMLRPDIFLGAHAEWFNYEQKRDRARREGVQVWVNPEEYRQFVARQKRAFEDQVDLELRPESAVSRSSGAARSVRRHDGPGLHQPVRLVGVVVDETHGELTDKPLRECGGYRDFVGPGALDVDSDRAPVAICDSHDPRTLSAFRLTHAGASLLGRREASVDDCFLQIQIAFVVECLSQDFQDAPQHAGTDPLLKPAVAG